MKQLVLSLLVPAFAIGFAGCSAVTKIAEGDDGGARNVDPPADAAPYNSDRQLAEGDVLDVAVYRGVRSGKEVYQDVVRVESGAVELGKYGSADVAGLNAKRAAGAIGSVFRRADKTSANRITAHVRSVNGTKVVLVGGGVATPGTIIWRSGMTASEAIRAAGGKKSGAGERFVYVSSKGAKKTLVVNSLDGSDPVGETQILPGDIIEVPVGL